MQTSNKVFHIVLGGLLALGCLAAPATAQAPLREDGTKQSHDEIDPAILLKAKPAYELLKQKNPPLVIDVRSRQEFNAEHIKGAISYPYTTIKMMGEYPFAKERKLLLYCGCPHHLSGMSADILKTKGYKDLHVIDEGYWGWKQQGLPIYKNPKAPKQSNYTVEGAVRQASGPVAHKDIFLLHPATGQLEATRTDAQGRFTMHLHFNGVEPHDQVLLQIDDKTLTQVALADLDEPLNLEMPGQVAAR